ncbi:ComF family protein [Pseudocnuella soli]|uniref:ComF family protein n=1 Tax=Pseudocnuella soli TaxID=2502779 RepID=UPI001F009764|nr:ComF family protein [Pseudocnuella soli]
MRYQQLFANGLHELKQTADILLHLIFPHCCTGCGNDMLQANQVLCTTCADALPRTHFEHHANNPIEKIFWGRLPITYASAQYFFTKDSVMQNLMHALKYRGNKEVGLWLGKTIGAQLFSTNRFMQVDALVPLPLYPEKEHQRGYNQARVLCDGMAQAMQKPVLHQAVIRTHHTESQTKKTRVERWQNMEGRFLVADPGALQGKHLLLVDDVVTTGATLEACGRCLLDVPDVRLSIATLCCAFN